MTFVDTVCVVLLDGDAVVGVIKCRFFALSPKVHIDTNQ